MVGTGNDKALSAYIKKYEKTMKDLEATRKMLIVANNSKPIPTIKEQLKSINKQITDAEATIAAARKIEKDGY